MIAALAKKDWNVDRLMRAFAMALTLLVLLVAIAGVYWVQRTPQPIPVAPIVDLVEPVRRTDMGLEPELIDGLQSRPLFWVGRRPLEPPVEPSPEEEVPVPVQRGPDPMDQVKLVGIYGSEASSGVIIQVDGERRRLRVLDSVEGWLLTHVSLEGALFVSDQGSELKERWLLLEHGFEAQ